jgi:RNA polymerase sigma factor (sigma-70 family)
VKSKARRTTDDLNRLTRFFEANLDVIRRAVKHRAHFTVSDLELGSDELADFEQEGYLEVWIRLPLFDGSRGSIATFADRAVHNRLRSIVRALRATKRTPSYACNDSAGFAPDPEFQQSVRRLVAELSPRDRAVCRLLTSCSRAEAARRAGLSRSAFYRAISRIRQAFRDAGF